VPFQGNLQKIPGNRHRYNHGSRHRSNLQSPMSGPSLGQLQVVSPQKQSPVLTLPQSAWSPSITQW
jgi:hypothetical protein